jgi:RNA polymerase sigma-70 factor (ECF subfamily)
VSEIASDEILMAAYQAGSQDAFRQLFDRHAGSVYGFLVRRLGDSALAEDLYQETFLRLHRARRSYDPSRPFRAWLFAIVHNLLADTRRTRRRRPAQAETPARGAGERAQDSAAENAPSASGATPEAIAAARQSSRALESALQSLPSDEATVLILARLEGLSYDDIGPIIGRSATATKQLAYRALKRVRAEMAAAGHMEET